MATILVAETGSINRHFLVLLLREHGHHVMEASSREETLRIVDVQRPDLVLIDIFIDGLDVGGLIASLGAIPRVRRPVLIFRAAQYLEPEVRELARALEGGFVARPAAPHALLSVIRSSLAERQAERQLPGRGLRSESIDRLVRSVLVKLCRYAEGLEDRNAKLKQRLLESNAQLTAAMSVVYGELSKRS